jgi:hypothetical protein
VSVGSLAARSYGTACDGATGCDGAPVIDIYPDRFR